MSDYGRVFHKSNLRRITLRWEGGRGNVRSHRLDLARLDSARRERKAVRVSSGFTMSKLC